VVNHGNDKYPKGKKVAGVEACRERLWRSEFSDPLNHIEFDGATGRHKTGIALPAEAVTSPRPREGFGTPLELMAEFGTSIALQLTTEWTRGREPLQAYEQWCDSVPMWIRHLPPASHNELVWLAVDARC